MNSDGRSNPGFVFGSSPQPDSELTERVGNESTEAKPDPQGGLVKAWSFSRLKNFESCAWRVYLTSVKKHKEESGEAAQRGTMIHQLGEDFAKCVIETLPAELKHFKNAFKRLRHRYQEGKVALEEDWGFDIDWAPTGWFDDNVWGRMKLDAFDREDETSAEVIDYKTGKKFGNELSHSSQAQLYAVGSFMRYPELQFIRARFFYLDIPGGPAENELVKNYSRERALLFLPKINERAIKLTSATEFDPSPSKYTCRWCPHRESGVCKWAEE